MRVFLTLVSLLSLAWLTFGGGIRMRRRCPPVPDMDNGRARGFRRIGETVRFTCRRSFYLQGVQTITCQNNSGQPSWSSDSRPICVSFADHVVRRAIVDFTVGSLSGRLPSRRVSNLGSIMADVTNSSFVVISDSLISLNGPLSILGRSVVIHAGEDDLGRGGNTGSRLGCGVIVAASEDACNPF